MILLRQLCRCNVAIRRFSASKPPAVPGSDAIKKYVSTFENYLKRSHPRVYRVQQSVYNGSYACLADLKEHFRILAAIRNGKSMNDCTIRELHLLLLIPGDIEKLLFLVTLIVIPFTFLFIASAFILLPRLLLTRHFWTPEQYVRFTEKILLQRRSRYFGPTVSQFLKAVHRSRLNSSSFMQEVSSKCKLSPQQQLRHASIFNDAAVQLQNLSFFHRLLLGRCYGMLPLWLSTRQLENRAAIMKCLDNKLISNDLGKLDSEDLNVSLFIRLINPGQFETDTEKRMALASWLAFSTSGKHSDSWILHAPVLKGEV